MKGDVVVIEKYHEKTAVEIVGHILEGIRKKATRYIITVAGESGSGKSEMGRAIALELDRQDIFAIVLAQDDYFFLPPVLNDKRRREDPHWLGPHIEVNLGELNRNLKDAVEGKNEIIKPLIDYGSTEIEQEKTSLKKVKVVIAEGTYTSLLRNIDTKIFIMRTRADTLEHRRKRNRGSEVDDPFIENILEMEHKIIAGHRYLADFIINQEYKVVPGE
jgi:uridine kinase